MVAHSTALPPTMLPIPGSPRIATPREEIANALTHGVGTALSIAGLVLMLVWSAQRGTAWHIVATAIYGSTLILLYLASTLYHAFPWPRVKHVFQILDHSAIFLLIAGSYTPFTLVTLRGAWGWTMFGIVWGIALLGILLKVFAASGHRRASVGLYIAMGWVVVIASRPLFTSLEPGGLVWLIAGGLAYTLGTVFYKMKKVPFSHAVWHLFVMGGSIFHWMAVSRYVIPGEIGS